MRRLRRLRLAKLLAEYPSAVLVTNLTAVFDEVAQFFQAVAASDFPRAHAGAFCLEHKPAVAFDELILHHIVATLAQKFIADHDAPVVGVNRIRAIDAAVEIQRDAVNQQVIALFVEQFFPVMSSTWQSGVCVALTM